MLACTYGRTKRVNKIIINTVFAAYKMQIFFRLEINIKINLKSYFLQEKKILAIVKKKKV